MKAWQNSGQHCLLNTVVSVLYQALPFCRELMIQKQTIVFPSNVSQFRQGLTCLQNQEEVTFFKSKSQLHHIQAPGCVAMGALEMRPDVSTVFMSIQVHVCPQRRQPNPTLNEVPISIAVICCLPYEDKPCSFCMREQQRFFKNPDCRLSGVRKWVYSYVAFTPKVKLS